MGCGTFSSMANGPIPEDDEQPQNEPEYGPEARLKEIEERAAKARLGSKLPDPPEWKFTRPRAPGQESGSPRFSGSSSNRGLGLAMAIGYAFVGPVVIGVLVGAAIDGRVGGTGTIIGLFAGTVAAFVMLIKLVNRLNDDGQ